MLRASRDGGKAQNSVWVLWRFGGQKAGFSVLKSAGLPVHCSQPTLKVQGAGHQLPVSAGP